MSADASAKAYRAAIVEENVLGKRTLSTRKDTATRLTALHGLDPSKPLFRVLRRLWAVDPAAHPQLALLNGLARDPLLLATTAQVMGMTQGELLLRSEIAKQRLQDPEPANISSRATNAIKGPFATIYLHQRLFKQ